MFGSASVFTTTTTRFGGVGHVRTAA